MQLIQSRYQETFSADISPNFPDYLSHGRQGSPRAALGYARAGSAPLFLESYLDQAIETLASSALDRPVERQQIVEIGNFAAVDPYSMIELWGAAANDLAEWGDVAVATLTAPLRRMFRRIGIPFTEIAPARRERLGENAACWGSYFDQDPMVCAGIISDGQSAMRCFLGRRNRRKAA